MAKVEKNSTKVQQTTFEALQISDDLLTWAAHYVFTPQPKPKGGIKRELLKLGMKVKSNQIFKQVVPELIRRGWVRLLVKGTDGEEIRDQFGLEKVRVTRTTLLDDVAAHAAEIVRDLILEKAKDNKDRVKIHVGFSGGSTMRAVIPEADTPSFGT